MGDQRKRSILKTLSWRGLATLATVFTVLGFTGDVTVSLGVGGIEVVAKIVLYYFHERSWERIRWGRYP